MIAAIDPDKDVDGLTVINAGRLAAGLPGLFPCTPLGCVMLLEDALGELARQARGGDRPLEPGRQADRPAAAGQGLHGHHRPLAHRGPAGASAATADILVAAVGRPQMVKGDWIKPGAAVIDVGINRVPARDRRGRRGRQDPAGRRRGLRGGGRGRRLDHAGAGRRRADDHRLPAAEHPDRGQAGGRDSG